MLQSLFVRLIWAVEVRRKWKLGCLNERVDGYEKGEELGGTGKWEHWKLLENTWVFHIVALIQS